MLSTFNPCGISGRGQGGGIAGAGPAGGGGGCAAKVGVCGLYTGVIGVPGGIDLGRDESRMATFNAFCCVGGRILSLSVGVEDLGGGE